MDFSYTSIADTLKRIREAADSYTPSLPTAAGLMAGPAGWLGVGAQNGALPTAQVLNNHQPPLSPIGHINQGFQGFQAPPPASLPGIPNTAGPTDAGANARVAQGFEPFGPYGLPQSQGFAPQAAPQAPAPSTAPAATPVAQSAPVPLPGPRPDAAPMATTAGPSLIDKMLSYLHRRQDGGPSFNADASTFGGDTARDAYNS